MGLRCRIAAGGRRPTGPPAARFVLSPRDPFSALFTGIAAYAQFVGRNYAEAMRLAREAIRQRSDFVGASGAHRRHRHGRRYRGRCGGAPGAAPRARPDISLAWIRSEMPIMQGGELEHYLEALRRAGSD